MVDAGWCGDGVLMVQRGKDSSSMYMYMYVYHHGACCWCEAAAGITEEAIKIGAKVRKREERGGDSTTSPSHITVPCHCPICVQVVWMQLGVTNHAAAAAAETKGIRVVMDRCPKVQNHHCTPSLHAVSGPSLHHHGITPAPSLRHSLHHPCIIPIDRV